MKIALVTDSTSDLPDDLVKQHHVEVVPAILNLSGQSYEDGKGLTREEFYRRLPALTAPPTTAAPSVGSFQKQYDTLFKSGITNVLSIHAASALSGIFNAARLAAESFGGRVRVIDSEQITLGLGFQVLAAAEAIARGAILDEILSIVASVRQRVRVVALLDTLEYLHRSGRVSWAKAMIGGLLNLKLLVELRFGIVARLGQARTHSQGVAHLIEALQSWGPLERLAVLHTNAEAAALRLLTDLTPRLPTPPLIVNVTTIIGAHVGPNGLGFAALPS